MRTVSRVLLPIIALGGASACSPVINETLYQNYEIRLWGPDLSNPASASPDPFAASQSLRVRIQLWEDRDGKKSYAAGRTLPEEFKTFQSEIVQEFPPTKTKFALGDLKIPRLDPVNQAGFFITAEILGLDETKSPIARARCPITEIKVKSSNVEPVVTCRPFFGLIGKWNTLEPMKRNRWRFGADVVPGTFTVVAAGGRYFDGTNEKTDNSIEVFSPPLSNGDPTGHWKTIPNTLGVPRFDLTATATGSGNFVMLLGGKTAETAYAEAVDKYNVATESLDAVSFNLAGKRGEHGAALLGGETLLLAGGFSTSSGANLSVEKVTPNDAADASFGAGNRKYPCVTQVRTNSILICGGNANEKSCLQTDGAAANTAGNLSVARDDAKCAAVDGKVYVVGGNKDMSVGKKIEVWSEGAGFASFGGELTTALTRHAIAAANGKVLVSGGYSGSVLDKPLATGFVIDPETAQVTTLSGDAEMASKRAWHQMVAFADGTIMVLGGKPENASDKVGVEMFVVPD